MNRYPAWTNFLVFGIVAVGILLALPNIYGEAPALQVSIRNTTELPEGLVTRVESELRAQDINVGDVFASGDWVVARFPDVDTQLRAKDVLSEGFVDDVEYPGAAVALTMESRMPNWLRAMGIKPMSLGLDLRGGVHFLYEVNMQEAIDQAMERYVSDLKSLFRDNDLAYRDVVERNRTLSVGFKDNATRDQARDFIEEAYPEFDISNTDISGQPGLVAALTEEAIKERKDFAIQQNITTIRNRVNEIGVAEPIVQRQGGERIVVQLPGVQDPAEARKILSSTATLEYRPGDDSNSPEQAERTGRIPIGSKLYTHRNGSPILLKRDVIVTGDNLANASASFDENGLPAVLVTLDAKGGKRMEEFTKENVGKPMGVVFIESERKVTTLADGTEVEEIVKTEEVISLASIRGVFSTRFQTTGLEQQESVDLALLLRAGALAAPIFLVEERTIGPSLGKDNIDRGMKAIVFGFLAVVVFMLVYYRVFGIFANLALLTNLVLITALLSLLQASLTLPGIAGIVLTVGMAVDANVLIFERIREELRNGSTPQASIHAGYEKAFWSIADANITTFIAAVVLWLFGTGPIKGFATTLALGIVTSMFTAIVGTRALVNWLYGDRQLKDLPV